METQIEEKIDRLIDRFDQTDKTISQQTAEFQRAKWWAIGTAIAVLAIAASSFYLTIQQHVSP